MSKHGLKIDTKTEILLLTTKKHDANLESSDFYKK